MAKYGKKGRPAGIPVQFPAQQDDNSKKLILL
jgi:hypothetical protein